MSALEDRLRRLILDHGPISVARYMAWPGAPCTGLLSAPRSLGTAGDFVTAPEVSQLFGELIGLALVQHWLDLGRPGRGAVVELGPGRGTLMAALRAAKVVPEFGAAMTIHLVETSLALRERQAAALPACRCTGTTNWPACRRIDRCWSWPTSSWTRCRAPVRAPVGRWHERLVGVDEDGAFRFVVAPRATPFPQAVGGVDGELADGTLLELGPAGGRG